MSDPIYPAEPPVDLRSARKITPPPAPNQPDPGPDLDVPADLLDGPQAPGDDYDTDWIDEGGTDHADPVGTSGGPVVVTAQWLDDLLPTPAGAVSDPATWGRRGWWNTVTAGAVALRARPDEVLHRRAVAAVGQPLVGRSLVMVANPKGGQKKTVTSLMLAETFAAHRRGSAPVVWDNNEADGTLGLRAASAVPNSSVWDLIEHAELLTSPTAAAADLSRFLRPQPTGAEVLAADDSAERMDQLGAGECEAVHSVLRRWREMVIVDTGNNHRRDNWLWTADHADLLVVPIMYAADATVKVLKMAHALRRRGLDHLLDTAIVVCTPNAAGDTPALRGQIHTALAESGLRTILEVPFEAALLRGGRIEYSRLPQATRRAWVQVCAVAATTLAQSTPYRVDGPGHDGAHPQHGRSRPERFAAADRHLDDVVRGTRSSSPTPARRHPA